MNSDAVLKVTVLDMQPIDPAIGGGRLRLLGLYHALGTNARTLYVGTYDWRGPGYRRQMLSPTLEELLVPLSDEHFSEAESHSRAAGGRVVIDSTFPELARLSPDYIAAARKAASHAKIVIFSHPWVYPLVRDVIDHERQLVVYDAHNVEGLLRMELLDDGAAGTDIVRNVIHVERELCRDAHLILTCSHEDRMAFNRLYEVPFERMRVFPNGTFTDQISPATSEQKAAARDTLKLGSSPVAFFIGSNYTPNVQAARFIADNLCLALPHISFVIAGGVGEIFVDDSLPFNLRVAGSISEDEKRCWLQASDIAINPMFGGSGTNIKMFDYMAAGLPILTTPIGARGIETSDVAFAQASPETFPSRLDDLSRDVGELNTLGTNARQQVEATYSWRRLSGNLGEVLQRRSQTRSKRRPYFSVVVPTFERHESLTKLVDCLVQQSCTDFELIIVDQSQEMWPDRDRDWPINLHYAFTDVRGAVRARNAGADLALGSVIAFVDDDCEPCRTWLSAARDEFAANDIVGVEGLVESDRFNDPSWRPVTNRGFEGIAFLTANLMIRLETFHRINGFDIAFDNPHFREDTDLAWRALEVGRIPFSSAAKVFHPAQPRSLDRESFSERAKFFEKDALLLQKHPVRYRELMYREGHWARNVYFWIYLLAGAKHYRIEIPDDIRSMVPKRFREELARASA